MSAPAFFTLPAVALLALAAAVAIAGIVHGLRMPAARGAKADLAWLTLRWIAAAILAASAAWIVISPRADQPVLDLLERVFPAVRAAYMDVPPAPDGDRVDDVRVRDAREARRGGIALVFALFAVALMVSKPMPWRRNPGGPAGSNRSGPR